MAKLDTYTPNPCNTSSRVIHNGDYGTKSMYVYDIPKETVDSDLDLSGRIKRLRTWGGNSLGSSVTAEQYAEIKAGTFRGMFLGDHWDIPVPDDPDGWVVTWRIMDFDYWYNVKSSTFYCGKHHVVLMPDTSLYDMRWSGTGDHEGGYYNSNLHGDGLSQARTLIINNTFGSAHILTKKEVLVNSTTSTQIDEYNVSCIPNGSTIVDTQIEVPDEMMIFGAYIHVPGVTPNCEGHRLTNSRGQLAAFAAGGRTYMGIQRDWYWLRDESVWPVYCVAVRDNGTSDLRRVDLAPGFGVRPVFGIIG